MGRRPERLTGGQSSRAIGVVSGFVLKLARQSTALTQQNLADALEVDLTTVQGWESGRRPLAAISTGDFLSLSSRLVRLGAPPSTGRYLREAVEADHVLSVGITAGETWVSAKTHPLATSVHRWTTTNLITWPITGKAPQHLNQFTPRVARRGPIPSRPTLTVDERTRFLDHLQTIAERAAGADEALLRRQAVYLLGFDGRPHIVDWLHTEWNRTGHRLGKHTDITGLLEARPHRSHWPLLATAHICMIS